MKVTIVGQPRLRNTTGNGIWSSTGGCFFKRACAICPLYPYLASTPCYVLRERFMAAVAPTALPHTFDTDDYPEVLI